MAKASDPLSRYEARKKEREPFALRAGFEVRVHTRLREGGKERVQTYEGIVTATSGAGLGKTFTVRRVTGGIGVERIFPMFSPLVTDVEVLRATKVRRAKLTYLRKAEAQRRRKEDRGLMRRVEAEREAKRRAKEDAERKAREEREATEKAAKGAAEKKATEETEENVEPQGDSKAGSAS
ncbi:MAG: large subunit ribosomal protein L19 [Parcubacteria group bacterium Gr01-1014_38]|nr:MAG: large subunit ribosomal protein L19 [Parcubacteria group bacterium Gr01-1014_38]